MTDVISKITTPDGTQTIGGDQFDGQWVSSYASIASGATLASSGTKSYSLSSYLPNDSFTYEVLVEGTVTTGSTSGNNTRFYITNSNSQFARDLGSCTTRTSNTQTAGGTATIVVPSSNRNIVAHNDGNASITYSLTVRGYKKVGLNGTASNYIEKISIPNNSDIPIGGDTFSGQWRSETHEVFSRITVASGAYTSADLSSYIPNDGYCYEVVVRMNARTGTTSGNNIIMRIGTKSGSNQNPICCRINTRTSSDMTIGSTTLVPLGANERTLYVNNTGNATANTVRVWITSCRRIGKNITGNNYLTNIKTPDDTVVPFGGSFSDGQWVSNQKSVFSSVKWTDSTSGTTHTYTITNYLPTNDEWYEILCWSFGTTNTTSGNTVSWDINTSPTLTGKSTGALINTRSSSSNITRVSFILVGKQDSNGVLTVEISNWSTVNQTTGNNQLNFQGYRKLGTNV